MGGHAWAKALCMLQYGMNDMMRIRNDVRELCVSKLEPCNAEDDGLL